MHLVSELHSIESSIETHRFHNVNGFSSVVWTIARPLGAIRDIVLSIDRALIIRYPPPAVRKTIDPHMLLLTNDPTTGSNRLFYIYIYIISIHAFIHVTKMCGAKRNAVFESTDLKIMSILPIYFTILFFFFDCFRYRFRYWCSHIFCWFMWGKSCISTEANSKGHFDDTIFLTIITDIDKHRWKPDMLVIFFPNHVTAETTTQISWIALKPRLLKI